MMMILRYGLVLFRLILNSSDLPVSASQATHNYLKTQFKHIQCPLLASVCSAFKWCIDIHIGKTPLCIK